MRAFWDTDLWTKRGHYEKKRVVASQPKDRVDYRQKSSWLASTLLDGKCNTTAAMAASIHSEICSYVVCYKTSFFRAPEFYFL